MSPVIESTTVILAVATIILDILIVLGFVLLIFFRKAIPAKQLFRFISKNIVPLGFLLSAGGVIGSLFYSSIAGFTPCDLCWWQRVFLYPQALIFGLALFHPRWRKDEVAPLIRSSLILSIVGALIAVYNFYGQSFNNGVLACGASTVSCAKIYFNQFGFVTIPFMSLSLFAALLLVTIIRIYESRSR